MSRQRTAPDLQIPLGRALSSYRDDVRRFIAARAAPSIVRDGIDAATGYDAALWAATAELEWAATLVPERHGGAGGTLLESSVLLEEMGRALLPLPVLSAAVMAPLALLAGADDDARTRLLPRIADGTLRATFAHDRERSTVTVAAGRATGTLHNVVDGTDAAVVIALADDALVAIDPRAAGVTVTRETWIDPTRRIATIALDGASVELLGAAGDLATADAWIATLVAAEAVGGARRCLEMSTEWATLREQFGRPIATFQPIKHLCVDMLVAVEAATAATRVAARLGDAASHDHPAAARLALATAVDTYRRAGEDCMQIHGGMGYTWDHDVHLHLKRAKGDEAIFGSAARNRARLADLVGF